MFIQRCIQNTVQTAKLERFAKMFNSFQPLNTSGYLMFLFPFYQKVACIFDNGQGMTSEGLKAFASYFLTQTDRGLEPGTSTTFGFLDGNISKFGVGATQAVFVHKFQIFDLLILTI